MDTRMIVIRTILLIAGVQLVAFAAADHINRWYMLAGCALLGVYVGTGARRQL